MRSRTAFLLTFAVVAGQLLAVDGAMLNLLMPDAKLVSGIDLERARNSPFGQFVLNQVSSQGAELEKLKELTGLDPRRDVFEVVMAADDPAMTAGHRALVVVRGAFDPAKLIALAGTRAGNVTSYQGTQVIEMGGSGADATWVGFLGGMLVAGPQASVRGAIDRHRSSGKADAQLVARIQSASSKHDAWFLTTVSPGALAGNLTSNPNVKGAMAGDLIRGIESVTGGVKFGANVILSGEATARSAQDATALVDVMKFFATMAQSNGAKSGPLGMLDAVQMTADGRTVKFSLTTPEQDFEKLFGTGMNRVRSRGRAALD